MRDIEQLQTTSLGNITAVENIPRGAFVPQELLRSLDVPYGGLIAEFGIGNAKKAKVLKDLGFTVIGFDINSAAVGHARALGVESELVDVTDPLSLDGENQYFRRNMFHDIVMEGLLCNLMGPQLERAISVAQETLISGGRLFIADVLAADQPNPHMAHLLGREFDHWKDRWMYRYAKNRALGLPDRHFVVYAPGDHKEFEWSPVGTLDEIIKLPYFERFARHLDVVALHKYLKGLGMYVDQVAFTTWSSRTEATLSGVVLVAQKK